jgi:Tol biopolymer transport system component
MNADGTIDDKSATQLTTEYTSNTDASWSPSGKSIIFSCGNGKATVCIMDAVVGARPVVVPQVTAPYNGAISWCNDGYIYFEAGQATEPQQPTLICRVAVPSEMRER